MSIMGKNLTFQGLECLRLTLPADNPYKSEKWAFTSAGREKEEAEGPTEQLLQGP